MQTLPSSEFIWQPGEKDLANANLTHFQAQYGIESFDELLRRSTEDYAWFTDAILKYLDIRFRVPYSQVVDVSRGIAHPRWCVGAEMNIVDNCLDKYTGTEIEDQSALIWESEQGDIEKLTYRALTESVNQTANGLRALGLGKGDAIGIYMPMVPEIVVALLAIAKIGAVSLPLFSGYGAGAVASRLQDGEAVALLTAQRRAEWGDSTTAL